MPRLHKPLHKGTDTPNTNSWRYKSAASYLLHVVSYFELKEVACCRINPFTRRSIPRSQFEYRAITNLRNQLVHQLTRQHGRVAHAMNDLFVGWTESCQNTRQHGFISIDEKVWA